MIVQKQYFDNKYAGSYNVGPNDTDCFKTGAIVDLFVKNGMNKQIVQLGGSISLMEDHMKQTF